MSIYFSGALKRSAGVVDAIEKQLKLINLKPVKKIEVKFDPFHPKAVTGRDFLFHINRTQVLETNLNCIIKSNVVCDRSEPQVTISLRDEGCVKFLANNLTVLEILQLFNKHISSKVEEEPATAKIPLTKSEAKKKFKR